MNNVNIKNIFTISRLVPKVVRCGLMITHPVCAALGVATDGVRKHSKSGKCIRPQAIVTNRTEHACRRTFLGLLWVNRPLLPPLLEE